MMIPRKIIDEIKILVKQFIWGSSDNRKKMSLVGWDSICQPKRCGGLGLRRLRNQNLSFLLKLGFNIMSNKDALWVHVLRSKYHLKEDLPNCIAWDRSSFLWRSLSKDTSMVYEEGSSWDCLFGLLIWRLWKNPLRVDFKGSFKPPIEEESFEDLIFLNTDGAVQLESKNAAAGGVVHDANGDWIFGYNHRLGKCSIFNAELMGILEGLRLIQRRGHDEVIIQSDSLEAVKAILESTSTEANSTLIRRIQSILFQEKQLFLLYIPRDQNQVADCLAKQALI
ncbi:hypothetical protein Goarm_003622 [Gossypium armourianum]|uniref:RNase H type-1 domain-containing protein n=1 Tax=Gossypium armourianum TaxID=34283 RepID=A0A7J9K3T2_9ROSI|nr:hypothetical protein [Gossypium armourianum]